MLAAIILVVLAGVCAALGLHDGACQARRVRALEKKVHDLDWTLQQCQIVVGDVNVMQRKLWLRMDRIQRMVQERGWRDSDRLTVIDWRKPE